ncbi:MAG: hypothetical protein M0Z68_09375 [Gammaproteobacteria bacterium]|nr:hypothetical protein [Gammaproteobacteria bacterium]
MASQSKKNQSRKTQFIVRGPFDVPIVKHSNGSVTVQDDKRVLRDKFWSEIVGDARQKNGCYVFALRTGKGKMRPWYVGMTTEQTFEKECFSGDKPSKYTKAIGRYGACTPLLFLLECSTKIATNKIKELEEFLIGQAVAANPDIIQTKGIRVPTWIIPGVTESNGKGSVSKAVQGFRKTFGVRPPKKKVQAK